MAALQFLFCTYVLYLNYSENQIVVLFAYPNLPVGGGGDRLLNIDLSKESRIEDGGPLMPIGGKGSRGGIGGGRKSRRAPMSRGGKGGSLRSKGSLSSYRPAGLS